MVIFLETIYIALKCKWRLEDGTSPGSMNSRVQMPSRHIRSRE